jgi:hypothetical protein
MLSRAKIASFVTLLALGALSAVALASGRGGGDPAAVQTRDDQPEVRTEVVRKTVHRSARSRDDARHGRGREAEAADDRGRRVEAGDDRGRGVEAGDDRGRAVEAGDDGRRHGGHGADDGPLHDVFDDHRDDDAFDDHGGGGNSGPGSSSSGHGSGNSGSGGGD